MELGPMLRSLVRRRSASALLVLEVAVATVMLVNYFVIGTYYSHLTFAPSGVDEGNLVFVTRRLAPGEREPAAARERVTADLARLPRIPGVVAASAVDELPFAEAVQLCTVARARDWPWDAVAWPLRASDGVAEALGVRVLRGRTFAPGERGVAIVTSTLAERLMGQVDILGRRIEAEGLPPLTVVGVTSDFRVRIPIAPDNQSVLVAADLPVAERELLYVVRSAPGQAQAVAARVREALGPAQVAARVPELSVARSHRVARGAIIVVLWMTVIVVGVTLAGALAVTSFSVAERTRQIGVRRALGATRGDIVRYFLVENALATTAGIAIGLAITLPLNRLMSSMVPAVAWWQMALSTVLVWAAGLLSALAPALRAARTPPTVATRAL